MTAFRLISLSTHAALEMLIGLALMLAPFVTGSDPAGLLAGVGLGVLVTGMALGALDNFPIAAHVAADYLLAGALVATSLALAVVGDSIAAPLFLVAGVALIGLSVVTRYSRPPVAH